MRAVALVLAPLLAGAACQSTPDSTGSTGPAAGGAAGFAGGQTGGGGAADGGVGGSLAGGTGGGTTGGSSGAATGGAGGMPTGGTGGAGATAGSSGAGGMPTGGTAGVGAGATGGAAGVGPTGGSGGGGAAGASGHCATDLPGPRLIEVVTPQGTYCVDATEVTRRDYGEFMASNPSTAAQPAECSWNDSFAPGQGWPYAAGELPYPASFIDWCDAHAYCAWAGKRLCGRIGGGATPFGDFADAARSEWQAACSGDGTTLYPYGDTYRPEACVGQDYPGNGYPQPPATAVACQGVRHPGIFDLSGNLWEWEDSCDPQLGGAGSCRFRGGGFSSPAETLRCDIDSWTDRTVQDQIIGIRCCAD